MSAMLSFEDAPPYSVPVRFFLTAPVHGALAGLLIVWQGEAIYDSRWSAAALAVTHLLTVGVLMQVMIGALFQFLPVAAGASIQGSRRWAAVVHPALNLGVLALAAGFLTASPPLFAVAACALALGVGAFLFAALWAVLPAAHASPTIPALKTALAGLLVTVSIGLYLLSVYAFGVKGRPEVLTAQHAAWGLLGWSGLLVIGVSYVVVPMFQLTPPYRPAFSGRFAPLLAGLLVIWTVAQVIAGSAAIAVAGALLAAGVVVYAVMTLRLQAKSKRPRADVTVRYWRLGMGLAIAAAVVWAGGLVDPDATPARTAFLVGWLAIPGALAAVVVGMLYKVLPFLSWLHLQNRVTERGGGKVPHMGTFIPETGMRRQFWAHCAALLLLVASVFVVELSRVAGLALLMSFALLAANLAAAAGAFYRHLALLSAPPASPTRP
jgi:hypothetical protein